jgi:formylglycine-generating enzyme required for sulfatase activity
MGNTMKKRGSIISLLTLMTTCCVPLSADPPTGTRVGQTRDDNSLSTALVWIPPGTFTMGSPKGEAGRTERENPVSVTLTQGFWLGKHEVTQLEWTTVMHTTPWHGMENVREGDDYAASFINWDDAMKFCERLTETERRAGRLPAGWKYTLPTEAQWEYACRAGTTMRFSFGDDEANLFEYGWFNENTVKVGQRFAHQVGKKKANAWGLHDMHGNVYEWCRDRFADKLPGGNDPQGPAEGTPRVDRGGGWEDSATNARSGFRDRSPPDERNNDLGFRVALVPSGN